jgi:murein L,D-transpeptidase YcbB/YkuD
MRYASDLRFGRWNEGIYGTRQEVSLAEMAWQIAEDPAGIQAGLRKLDPPFAAYQRLAATLKRAQPEDQGQIGRTMERWRWLPRSIPSGAVIVNIPEFRLQALNPDFGVALDMRAIVGLPTHPTPQFTGNLRYLVFGPYWNVPRSILVSELLPDIVKDPTYLMRNAYEVMNAEGQVVSNGEVSEETLAGLKAGRLWVRQVPGSKNALGRVKFVFPNADDIYMHDTPSRYLFAREQRAFSHGCVRVEQPQALAEWTLRSEPDWTRQRIEASLKSAKPIQANLKEPIPVFLVYHTVTVGQDGEVHYWKDLYRQDAALEQRIAATTAEPGPRPRE